MEYGLTVGVVALVAAAMFVHTSAGITGVWKQATAATNKSPAASSASFVDCMGGAHGDSQVCSSVRF